MDDNLLEALELIAREKGVPAETILDALANALVSAYKRTPGAAEEARVTIDPDSGEIQVYGQELDEDGNVVREWQDTPDDFGRIAAQTAKQVIMQRLRDAKREQVFELYEGREGDLVTGIVQQSDHRYAILDLGNAEALMPSSERIPYERLERGARVKAYILEVRGESKGPQIVVSRSHPEFVRSLFELEVPELAEGVVEIKVIAREPGHRTKIAVASSDANVDPVGACVGSRGSRVRQVVNELRGEKVDVVEWRENAQQFIAEALSPARVKEVRIDDEEQQATVIVPDFQLSLAIGKEGQNARLAARLTGYKIDIQSESQDLGLVDDTGAPVSEKKPEEAPAAAADGPAEPEAAAAEEPADDDSAEAAAAAGVTAEAVAAPAEEPATAAATDEPADAAAAEEPAEAAAEPAEAAADVPATTAADIAEHTEIETPVEELAEATEQADDPAPPDEPATEPGTEMADPTSDTAVEPADAPATTAADVAEHTEIETPVEELADATDQADVEEKAGA